MRVRLNCITPSYSIFPDNREITILFLQVYTLNLLSPATFAVAAERV